MKIFTKKRAKHIRNNTPAECCFTLEHLREHLKSALTAEESGDEDQLRHDLLSVAELSYVMAYAASHPAVEEVR